MFRFRGPALEPAGESSAPRRFHDRAKPDAPAARRAGAEAVRGGKGKAFWGIGRREIEDRGQATGGGDSRKGGRRKEEGRIKKSADRGAGMREGCGEADEHSIRFRTEARSSQRSIDRAPLGGYAGALFATPVALRSSNRASQGTPLHFKRVRRAVEALGLADQIVLCELWASARNRFEKRGSIPPGHKKRRPVKGA